MPIHDVILIICLVMTKPFGDLPVATLIMDVFHYLAKVLVVMMKLLRRNAGYEHTIFILGDRGGV